MKTAEEMLEENVKKVTYTLEDLTRAGDVDGLKEYFEDAPEIGYVVDAGGDLKGAVIYVEMGGPTVSVDTYAGRVFGSWNAVTASTLLIRDVCDFIDEELIIELYRG